MKTYTYNDKTYTSLYQLRYDTPNLIFPSHCSDELLQATGIIITETPDPEPEDNPITELQRAKDLRRMKVHEIVVEVDGLRFEGNEAAQTRMLNAFTAAELDHTDIVEWVLADDTTEVVTVEQLRKAYILACKEMERLWLEPYAKTTV